MARVLLSILGSIALYDAVTAQTFMPTAATSTFPSCAVSCTVLLQAQTECTPPDVATTNDLTYENCFCQSSLLSALYSTPDSVCTSECTAESDRTELQTWFENFCSEVGQGIDPLSTTTTTPTPTATTIVTITSTRAPTTTATGTGSSATSATTSNKSWIQTHWQWILMLGILVLGFVLLTWGAIWLKRRHRRKVEERRAAMSGLPKANEKGGHRAATPDLWGPHQHMQHTHGFEYANPSIMGSGAVVAGAPASNERGDRRSKRVSSTQRKHHETETTERGGRPADSRRHSSKGKTRGRDSAAEVESEITPVVGERSRDRRRRGPDDETESRSDRKHQRRLREVRGSRRMDNDQT
ncbi:hypothetical protein EDD37DRAFT_635273 [Exophiala viscosa]|uniref:uncharacterized protein n=1 Tax=Exophiala viscosa TaxID=2486360 RepID=UPI00219D8F64|nr:hypothetical protein EDD37DRAFT_635273 [Exophiala viscosa]